MDINFKEIFSYLETQNVFSTSIIEWWLLKYSDFYKQTYGFVYSQHLFKMDDGSTVRLPPFGKPTDEEKFIDLYQALDTISELHRNEKYFDLQMVEYHKIKDSQSDLKNWVAANENFGSEKYVCFLIDYLDYDENNKEEHLKIFLLESTDLEIYIDRQDFKNTIDFLETFNELYWVQEILPENLNKTKIEM
ncbi:hypothetical protein QRD02_10450 [Aequorivita sp. SDUM287046]|uniref:Uncharacterized protein n=1 Tax=Aequorivita aurantiaca TaxID=3053356 RepID=A0ABT8DLB8_9FLAO|nr:hypothetical protein [Aequorivita aurantiaca]MDN3724804.1 hypothetical protein [Aequorivita aurantiaca]